MYFSISETKSLLDPLQIIFAVFITNLGNLLAIIEMKDLHLPTSPPTRLFLLLFGRGRS